MVFFVLTGIIGFLMLAAYFGSSLIREGRNGDGLTGSEASSARVATRALSLVIGLLLIAVISGCESTHRVPAGHVAVVYGLGGDITGQRNDGLQFTAPWQDVKVVSVQRQVFRPDSDCYSGRFHNCVDTFSKDNQDVFVVGTLNYHIDRENVQTLMRDNPNYVDRSIRSRFNQIVKDETVKFTASELAANREVIRSEVKKRLTVELANVGITVEDFLVDNIDFRDEFKTAIEDKVKAQQQALAAQNRVAIAEAEAKQKAAAAEGEANRLRIEAQGQADANKLLSASLTPELIQFTAIQKLIDNITIMLLPSDGNSLFDVTKLIPQQGQ